MRGGFGKKKTKKNTPPPPPRGGAPPFRGREGFLKWGGKGFVMEDTKTERLVSRVMHDLDQGAYIRSEAEWQALLREFFSINRSWTFKSGVCFYSGFFLAHRTGV